MKTRIILGAVCAMVAVGLASSGASRWPGWRGDGSGMAPAARPPQAWGQGRNTVWRVELAGEGSSSPVVWEDRVFVTASTDGGAMRHIICLAAEDGRELWRHSVAAPVIGKTDPKSGYAPATPVTDGKRVYAFFDSPGLVAVGLDGTPAWTVPLGPFDTPYNVASSPVLFGGLVIQCCDHNRESFLLAVDEATGQERWRTPRRQGMQFSTPLVIACDGAPQVVVTGAAVQAYDPRDGRELWSCRGLNPNVAPSAVWDGTRVYATSGRNGPAFAIDPRGRGDVTETHARLLTTVGGPYVPSPLALPELLLPGDNGHLRLLSADGVLLAQHRIRDHFTASPILAGRLIYWPAEGGKTYLVSAERVADSAEWTLRTVGVNELGERCLASPAAVGERLFLRTVKALYCLAGEGEAPAGRPAPLAGTFEELRARFEAHPAPEGDDVAVRLEVIELLATLREPQATPFLKTVALKDPHWDVSEAAAKALAQQNDAAVGAAALELMADWRPYLKVLAADVLGRIGSEGAVPVLGKAVVGGDALVRIACIEALGRLAVAEPALREHILPFLTKAQENPESPVRAAAHKALEQAMATTQSNDTSPRGDDRLLYGGEWTPPVRHNLRAGPIRLKFEDGELRYLYVGDKEVVRRIYFAVRDKGFDTVMPRFATMDIVSRDDGFDVTLDAVCRSETADYAWTGTIHGAPSGAVTFKVEGHANAAFDSPRVGFCVLYGSGSLAGQAFTGTDPQGGVAEYVFPTEVTPGALVKGNVASIRYVTAAGMAVTCAVSGTGFGMEDQRNFCDTSYKAYHSLGHSQWRPMVVGEVRTDTLSLTVGNAPAGAAAPPAGVTVRAAATKPAGRLPRLLPVAESASAEAFSFVGLNGRRDQVKGAAVLQWAFNPSAHMPDNDTFTENLPAILDQVRTMRAVAGTAAKVRLDRLGFDSPYPRAARDLRNGGLFGGAWLAAAIGYAGLAGVDEAVVAVGPGPAADWVARELGGLAGCAIHAVRTDGPPPPPVFAYATARPGQAKPDLWLVNLTDDAQAVAVAEIEAGQVTLNRLNTATLAATVQPETQTVPAGGTMTVRLLPYEVCRMAVAQ
ncbi:MAG: outer membrane biogenesis protein BamB [Lentisphaerae bacterium ADurb.BinA184]|nr:MAG: outer membrane biogenesis protein BamB [Lentisphaerae bacterium ADurb.BinA184]